MKISDDEKYLAIGTNSGMIKIYRVTSLNDKEINNNQRAVEHEGAGAAIEDGLQMLLIWQTHLNKVTDICFIKLDVCKTIQINQKTHDKS